MREATDGEVLNQWLRGVKKMFLTPFLFVLMSTGPIKTMREAPSGSYYPIVTSLILKCSISHRFTPNENPLPYYRKQYLYK